METTASHFGLQTAVLAHNIACETWVPVIYLYGDLSHFCEYEHIFTSLRHLL